MELVTGLPSVSLGTKLAILSIPPILLKKLLNEGRTFEVVSEVAIADKVAGRHFIISSASPKTFPAE